MSTSFATSFWGNEDRGLDVLHGKLKKGKHVTAEIAALFKERASIEEDFGKRLAKLAKAFTTVEEIGTLRETLDLVKAELETSARAHLDIANEIRLQLEKPTSDFMNTQSVVRKTHHSNVEKRLKAKAAMTANAEKCKNRYVSKCHEVTQLLQQQPNLPPKDAEKHQQRLEKSQQQANQNDLEYMSAVERLAAAHTLWEDDYRTACVEFQRLEEERIDYLRGRLWAYANIISTLCVADDESCERIRTSIERCHVSKDIALFLDTSSTGTTIPVPEPYINYYTQTSERAVAPLVTRVVPNTYDEVPGAQRAYSSSNLSGQQPLLKGPAAFNAAAVNLTNFTKKMGDAARENGAVLGSLFKKGTMGGNGSNTRNSVDRNGNSGALQQPVVVTPSVTLAASSGVYNDDEDEENHQQQSDEVGEFSYDPYDFTDGAKTLFEVRVLYDYQSQAFEELTVVRGQVVPVIAQHEDGWWEGIVVEAATGKRRKGLFPSNFVERL
ncbi:hypothetical protein HDU79_005261 [Rhizoclosmatium sp. JEL0117]|nr:hypothetical protein HDU79_005252 [Rhizoclosmatium sp. JEL0117]KAJ3298889.1 hypothetical protein HDU79_005261 [Rhizoclosmatium sp. JEL0117]